MLRALPMPLSVVLLYKASYQNIRKTLTLEATGEPTTIEVASFANGEGRAQAKTAQKKLVDEFQQRAGNTSATRV